MNNIVLIVLYLLGSLIILADILTMYLAFNKTGSGKYNFLSFFPYELNPFKRHNKVTYIYEVLFIIGSICLTLFLGYFCFIHSDKIVIYFISIIMFISLLSFNILFFIKLTNYRLHVGFAITFAFSTFLAVILEFLYFTKSEMIGLIISTPVINMVITCLCIVFMLILFLNKSYKDWAKMVKIDAQTYNRPKYNYLAMLEWGTLIVHIIAYLPFIVILF